MPPDAADTTCSCGCHPHVMMITPLRHAPTRAAEPPLNQPTPIACASGKLGQEGIRCKRAAGAPAAAAGDPPRAEANSTAGEGAADGRPMKAARVAAAPIDRYAAELSAEHTVEKRWWFSAGGAYSLRSELADDPTAACHRNATITSSTPSADAASRQTAISRSAGLSLAPPIASSSVAQLVPNYVGPYEAEHATWVTRANGANAHAYYPPGVEPQLTAGGHSQTGSSAAEDAASGARQALLSLARGPRHSTHGGFASEGSEQSGSGYKWQAVSRVDSRRGATGISKQGWTQVRRGWGRGAQPSPPPSQPSCRAILAKSLICARPHQWQDEDLAILRLSEQLGQKWSAIAKFLPGRTDDAVRNRYLRLIKKKEQVGGACCASEVGRPAALTANDLADCNGADRSPLPARPLPPCPPLGPFFVPLPLRFVHSDAYACHALWLSSLSETKKGDMWTADEDATIVDGVNHYGQKYRLATLVWSSSHL